MRSRRRRASAQPRSSSSARSGGNSANSIAPHPYALRKPLVQVSSFRNLVALTYRISNPVALPSGLQWQLLRDSHAALNVVVAFTSQSHNSAARNGDRVNRRTAGAGIARARTADRPCSVSRNARPQRRSATGVHRRAALRSDARRRPGRMIVDGKLYPLHSAISERWKVHYFSADMARTRRSPSGGCRVPYRYAGRARSATSPPSKAYVIATDNATLLAASS
jgi:hypothetical protein